MTVTVTETSYAEALTAVAAVPVTAFGKLRRSDCRTVIVSATVVLTWIVTVTVTVTL